MAYLNKNINYFLKKSLKTKHQKKFTKKKQYK